MDPYHATKIRYFHQFYNCFDYLKLLIATLCHLLWIIAQNVWKIQLFFLSLQVINNPLIHTATWVIWNLSAAWNWPFSIPHTRRHDTPGAVSATGCHPIQHSFAIWPPPAIPPTSAASLPRRSLWSSPPSASRRKNMLNVWRYRFFSYLCKCELKLWSTNILLDTTW